KNARYVSYIDENTNKKTYTKIEHVYNAIEGAHWALPEDQPIADISAKQLADATPITYHLTISSAGKMNFDYSYNNGAPQPVLANIDIASINGEPPESFRFGFSAGTGGSYNYHALTCFTASPLRSDSSASANTQEGKRVSTETQFFLASYASDSWWGALVANPIIIDDDDSTLSVGTVANWDAKCVLTGGACSTMGTDADGPPIHHVDGQVPSDRTLLSWDEHKGIALQWNKLGSTEQEAFENGRSKTQGRNRLDWLRGERSQEQLREIPGDLRARDYVLGDIINSSPTFVGAPVPGTHPDGF